MKNRKGFIGPIGDDLPSLLIVILALGLFFSSILFVFNAYTEKLNKLRITGGAIEAARAATSLGLFDETFGTLPTKIDHIADSYGIDIEYGTSIASCTKPNDYVLKYFVADKEHAPAQLTMCFHSR